MAGSGKNSQYAQRTEQLAQPILDQYGFELVDTEYVREGGSYYLRVYADKPGGITIDDLEMVSRILSDRLDEEDFIDDAYTLEVSSPGLTRPLRKDRDLERNIGNEVEIRLYRAEDGRKEWCGVLTGYDADTITIEDPDEGEVTLKRGDIALIRLALDF